MPLVNISIIECEFNETKKIWADKLWPERESIIEEVSAIDKDGSINMQIMQSTPYFFKCISSDGETLGVISGFQTSQDDFRSRGIWVDEQYRQTGIGKNLMSALVTKAIEKGCKTIWSMPRQSSWNFYSKLDFTVLSEITKYEFGPHYLAEKKIT